jgi:hypothetical protein
MLLPVAKLRALFAAYAAAHSAARRLRLLLAARRPHME